MANGALSREDVYDVKVYGTNDDGSTYKECFIYVYVWLIKATLNFIKNEKYNLTLKTHD